LDYEKSTDSGRFSAWLAASPVSFKSLSLTVLASAGDFVTT
jgi:hypothetical protein